MKDVGMAKSPQSRESGLDHGKFVLNQGGADVREFSVNFK